MVRTIKKIVDVVRRHPMKIRLALVGILFGILFFNVHPREIVEAFSQAQHIYLVYALVLLIPNLGIQFLKWHFLIRGLNPKPSLRTAVLSVIGGFFLGASTPGRTGELARGMLIPGHSKIKVASLTMLDKGFNLITVYMAGLISLSLVLPGLLAFVPLIAGFIFCIVLANIHRTRPPLERFFHRFTKSERVDNLLAAFDTLTIDTVGVMIVYSIVFYLVYTFQYLILIRCFTDISIITAFKTIPLVFVINATLPIAIGDLGVKEMAAVHILGAVGITGGEAFSATIIQNVMTFLIPSIAGGIIFTLYRPKHHE